jgi:hypothetical protein
VSEEDVGGCQRRQTRGTQKPPGADGLPVFVLISEYLDLSAAKYDRRSDVQVQLVEELIPVTSVVSTLVHNSFVFERPQYTERALVDVPKFLIFGSGCAIRPGPAAERETMDVPYDTAGPWRYGEMEGGLVRSEPRGKRWIDGMSRGRGRRTRRSCPAMRQDLCGWQVNTALPTLELSRTQDRGAPQLATS